MNLAKLILFCFLMFSFSVFWAIIAFLAGSQAWYQILFQGCVFLFLGLFGLFFFLWKRKIKEKMNFIWSCPVEHLQREIDLFYQRANLEKNKHKRAYWLKRRAALWKILQRRLETEKNLKRGK